MAEANQPVALPEALVKEIHEVAEDRMNYYYQVRSAEDQAKDEARIVQWKNSPEVKAEKLKEIQDAFVAADANGDGALDAQEFETFKVTLEAQSKAREAWIDDRGDYWGTWFNHACKANPDTGDTMTLQDFFAVMQVSQVKMLELKDARDAAKQ